MNSHRKLFAPLSVDGRNLLYGGGSWPWAVPLITGPWVPFCKSSHIMMSTLLKCFQAEIGLSPLDQPDSGLGSKRIYSTNLLSPSALHLDVDFLMCFNSCTSWLNCACIFIWVIASVSKRWQRRMRANTGCQNLLPESGSDALDWNDKSY